MRIVIQRVSRASVSVEGNKLTEIGPGYLLLLGIEHADSEEDASWLVKKVLSMRLFNDEFGVMNISVHDKGHDILVISQFTLHASTKKGNRPSYIKAARPEQAIPLYEFFCAQLKSAHSAEVKTGEFGADMKIELVNDGPVTILLDSQKRE